MTWPKKAKTSTKKRTPKIKAKTGKKNVNAIKSSFDGINFASNLELFAYKELKRLGLYGEGKLLYEGKEFIIVDDFKFKGKKYRNIKITPDFVDITNKVIFECKGFMRQNALFPMRWKLMKKYLSEKEPDYEVFMAVSTQKNVLLEIEEIKKLYQIKNVI